MNTRMMREAEDLMMEAELLRRELGDEDWQFAEKFSIASQAVRDAIGTPEDGEFPPERKRKFKK